MYTFSNTNYVTPNNLLNYLNKTELFLKFNAINVKYFLYQIMAMLVFNDQLIVNMEKELSHFSHIMSRHTYTHTKFKGSMNCSIW